MDIKGRQLPILRHKVALGFLDLIEIKFVGAFLDRGVSWPMLHKAREKAATLYPGVSLVLRGVLSNPPESLKGLLDGPTPESHER